MTRISDPGNSRKWDRVRHDPRETAAEELELAKTILVDRHDAVCGQAWGPCTCLLALAIRSIDSVQAMDASCEWQIATTTRSRSFWARTAKGRH